jgi:uncharacterized membrane protein YjgN (DUF898 family)
MYEIMDTDQPNSEDNPQPEDTQPAPPVDLSPTEETLSAPLRPVDFEFTGDTGEYFKIWIVNLLLSIVTLGFYWPWAAVRSRRYFHANTRLEGHSFDYLAKPKSLLIGYLVALMFFALYLGAGFFNPFFVYPVLIIYGIAAPWMVYKTLRFRSRNTAYRNVRFKFSGHLGDSYVTYLGWAFVVPFTLGLIIPYWAMKKKEYFMDNLQFGKSYFNFKPNGGEYYKYYLLFGAIGFALYLGVILLAFGVAAIFGGGFGAAPFDGDFTPGMITSMVAGYLLLIVVATSFQQGLWMMLFNYNLSVWSMGAFRFESKMKIFKFLGVAVSNVLASVFTLGLLVPWAKIRMAKYQFENLYVLAPNGELGEHFAAEHEDEGAFGEAATDFMDFEIGL